MCKFQSDSFPFGGDDDTLRIISVFGNSVLRVHSVEVQGAYNIGRRAELRHLNTGIDMRNPRYSTCICGHMCSLLKKVDQPVIGLVWQVKCGELCSECDMPY